MAERILRILAAFFVARRVLRVIAAFGMVALELTVLLAIIVFRCSPPNPAEETRPEMDVAQQTFMLFFSIIWGTSANAWPRWKPFHWTLVMQDQRVGRRVLLSLALMNFAPISYFALFFNYLGCGSDVFWVQAVRGALPALAGFGFYRVWMGFVGRRPTLFYYTLEELWQDHREWLWVEPAVCLKPLSEQDWPEEKRGGLVRPDNLLHIRPELSLNDLGWGLAYIFFFPTFGYIFAYAVQFWLALT